MVTAVTHALSTTVFGGRFAGRHNPTAALRLDLPPELDTACDDRDEAGRKERTRSQISASGMKSAGTAKMNVVPTKYQTAILGVS